MNLDAPALRQSSKVLRLLFHRNKNQHRQAKWWKWFSMLKRSVGKLIVELEASDVTRQTARVNYMRAHLLPHCYVCGNFQPFLYQENQFAALGTVLLAELANIHRLISAESEDAQPVFEVVKGNQSNTFKMPTIPLPEEFGEAVRRENGHTAPDFARNSTQDLPAGWTEEPLEALSVDRKASAGAELPLSSTADSEKSANVHKVPPTFRRRQNRKRMDAIDNLFQGLD